MNPDDIGNFLSRWSRRKLQQSDPKVEEASQSAPAPEPAAPPAAHENAAPPQPLPPVESLTPESDFTPFMRPDVEPGLKQAALKQLFKDPRFNVMDGLDTYIEDYSIPDPIPAEMMKKLYQARQHVFSDEEKAVADAADAEDAAARVNAEEISAALAADSPAKAPVPGEDTAAAKKA